jgi:hypothetical protein
VEQLGGGAPDFFVWNGGWWELMPAPKLDTLPPSESIEQRVASELDNLPLIGDDAVQSQLQTVKIGYPHTRFACHIY